MTNNEKLAVWQGWVLEDAETNLWEHPVHGDIWFDFPKDYLNDDAAAMSLLDTLVEKGFVVELCSNDSTWACDIIGYIREYNPTRRGAVVAAVLKLIQGDKNEYEKGCTNNSFDAEPQSTIKIFDAICNINYFVE